MEVLSTALTEQLDVTQGGQNSRLQRSRIVHWHGRVVPVATSCDWWPDDRLSRSNCWRTFFAGRLWNRMGINVPKHSSFRFETQPQSSFRLCYCCHLCVVAMSSAVRPFSFWPESNCMEGLKEGLFNMTRQIILNKPFFFSFLPFMCLDFVLER